MRKSVQVKMAIIMMMLISFSWGGQEVQAQPVTGLRADVAFMDDYGDLLVGYHPQIFQVENNRMVYSIPPEIDGFTFATVNVLKLEVEDEVSYRVNYFYTQDDVLPGVIPEPVALDEMPTKRAVLEIVDVWVSWTDESMKELSDTKTMELEYFWETYKVPEPKSLQGYNFSRLETGMKSLNGIKIPHLVYIYTRVETYDWPPSLIFDHLIENRTVRTIRKELPPPTTQPKTIPETKPETKPETIPETKPETKPETIPETKPETIPETKPETKPGTKPETKPGIKPNTKPKSTTTTGALTKPRGSIEMTSIPSGGPTTTKPSLEHSSATQVAEKNFPTKPNLKRHKVTGALLVLLVFSGFMVRKFRAND